MPFHYHVPVPTIESRMSETDISLRLVKCLVLEHTWVEADTPIAIIAVGDTNYEIQSTGPGILRRWLCQEGATVRQGSALAEIAADGESLPYHKPASKYKRL